MIPYFTILDPITVIPDIAELTSDRLQEPGEFGVILAK